MYNLIFIVKNTLKKGVIDMSKIKCREFECKHNYCEACMKNSIEVSGDAYCDSFDTKHDGSPIDMEFGMEEDFFINHNDKEVICHCTSCISNSQGICSRNNLQVGTLNDTAKCESYQKK